VPAPAGLDDPGSSAPERTAVAYLDQLSEVQDFDIEAVRRFRMELRPEIEAHYPPSLTEWEFLTRAGLARDRRLTRTGVLLFGISPSNTLPSAHLKCSRYAGTAKDTARMGVSDCDRTIPAQILAANNFVREHAYVGESLSDESPQTGPIYDYPMLAVREIVANALAHRDYSMAETAVHLRLFSDRMEVTSPGSWLGLSTTEAIEFELESLEGEASHRNTQLARALSWISYVEGEGRGIPMAVCDCRTVGVRPPRVRIAKGLVTVILYPRSLESSPAVGTPADAHAATSGPVESPLKLVTTIGAATVYDLEAISRERTTRGARVTAAPPDRHARRARPSRQGAPADVGHRCARRHEVRP
jgi:predicted HTH transcriptional regulator